MYYFIPAWYGQTDEFWKTSIDLGIYRQKIDDEVTPSPYFSG
ncbi:MAG: hypothetical protein ACLTZN_03770 [Streptococcus sp.]